MFEALDLPPATQAVYEALVDGSPVDLEQLLSLLRMAKAEAQCALDDLEKLGLVHRLPGAQVRYAAIAPDIALEVLFLQREEQLKLERRYAEQLSARFHQAAAGRHPAELVEILTGRPAIRQRWEQLQRGARSEIRGIDKPPYTVSTPVGGNVNVETEMLAKGVRYRIIYDTEGLADFHDLEDDVEASIRLGEQARVLTNAPCKLVIFDERYAMIPLQAAPTTVAAMIVVHQSGLLEAMCALFENLWRQALPFPLPVATQPPTDPDSPTIDEERLLALLITGMPDEAIAKHLDLSYRTYQRRFRDLMNRLGAETRFQAGLRAALLGWIKEP